MPRLYDTLASHQVRSSHDGRVVVEDGELRTTSEQQAVTDLVAARKRLLHRV